MKLKPTGLVWIAPLTLMAAGAGFATGHRFLFPLLCTLPAYPYLVTYLRSGRRERAVAAMLVWAAALASVSVLLCLRWPAHGAQTVWNGREYAGEMFLWLRTGVGTESDPARFLPQHALHAGLFTLLSLATGSVVSLFFGTLLLNYMAFYVAQVILASGGAPLAVALAWHPWSILRVAAFVILGVVLAEPLLRRITGGGPERRGAGRWLAVAAAGLVADAVLKWLLAPTWRLWLHQLTSGGSETWPLHGGVT